MLKLQIYKAIARIRREADDQNYDLAFWLEHHLYLEVLREIAKGGGRSGQLARLAISSQNIPLGTPPDLILQPNPKKGIPNGDTRNGQCLD